MKTNIKNILRGVGVERTSLTPIKKEVIEVVKELTKEEKLQLELKVIAKKAKKIREIEEEKKIAEEKRVYDEKINSIRNKLENPFSLGREVDTTPMREAATNNVLPKALVPKQTSYPEPFEEEPALNRELAEFKQKINEHLSKMGFAGGGGGAGFMGDLDDVTIAGRTHKSILMWNDVTNKYEVADPDLDAGIANEDDSGDEIILNGTTTSGADESGSIQQENETRMSLFDMTSMTMKWDGSLVGDAF
jgi:hypothetical protein|tara:strand:- start:83 stop:826 length:744 start_codon:yes stop_codon:yes gene_type:complete